jgi:hypothetical protein
VITLLARIMSNHDFITLKVKMGIKGLGNEVYFKNMISLYSETDDTRRKRVSSLETCQLQDQLVIGELGASCKPFSKI